ncbi:MerR family transcriptional regulator [Streptomyces sp. ID05-04B]|uniref:MerR family transcriptional regulator n=1 Tax=Streptomyces sp. ID05-04B TaxID=3028661 RepID=UPI0029C389CF|nr:MerR family transcriptional regulator [Streptomyces sp. ID05-04B]MDX5569241.1 MerR family transcriptional regulator [Streptomyces sp. ID05-04B]
MPHPDEPATEDGREDATGQLWFTVRAAAAFTGRGIQTVYSWERRGHLRREDARTDERGRRIYSQQQIADAERAARLNAAAARRLAG